MMVLVPPSPLLPPSQILPGSLSPAVRPFPLFLFPFASFPSVLFSWPLPPAASDLPSSIWWTPPADSSGGCRPMPSPGFQSPVCQFASNLCGSWYLAWVWVEGRRRQRPPQLSLSPLWRGQVSPGGFFLLFGFLLASGFLPSIFKPDGFCQHSWPSSNLSLCPSLSMTPPPPLSLYNRTCPSTIPLNGMVFLWSFRSSVSRWPCPSCQLPDAGPRPCPPPPTSILLGPHHQGLVAP